MFIIWFFMLCLASALVQAQGGPEFIATVSSSRVAQHSVFEIQFELKQAEGSSFQPPSFQDFRVVGGPSMGSSTMIINGVVSQSQSWSYSLLATKQGKFTIGPATIVAGRKKLTTRPVTVEVVAQKELATPGSASSPKDQILLLAETDKREYYPGQQIILTYRLLFRDHIQTVNTLAEDDYAEFFVQYFSDFSREATTETVNGVQYTSRIVKSMALFAHQSGSYTIDPMIMNAGVNAPFPGNQGFFTMRRIMDVQVASVPLTIRILSLPGDAPETFSGAVGQYQMKMVPEKTNLTTDEAFSFQLEISGNGDSRRWDVPVPVSSGAFEVYDPKIIDDKVFDENNQLLHTRKVGYNMIPAQPGEYTVHVPFTYFDPEAKSYVTISSDTIHLQVTKGTGVRLDTMSHQKSSDSDLTLMPLGHQWFKDRFWVSFPHLFLFTLLLSGSGYGAWLTYKRRRDSLVTEEEKTRINAGLNARIQLDTLAASPSEVASSSFYEKATAIYYKFLTDRFLIPSSELDEANILKYLANANIPDQTIQKAVTFFNQCLEVRYGGIPGGYSREEMLRRCRELTEDLELRGN